MVCSAPGIFRLDQVAALKRVLVEIEGGLSTLVAGVVLAAKAPPRLVLLLGGFFVLTVGGLGVRGVTSFFGGDVVSGLQNLADFGLQVPTVALALGVILSDRWKARVDR